LYTSEDQLDVKHVIVMQHYSTSLVPSSPPAESNYSGLPMKTTISSSLNPTPFVYQEKIPTIQPKNPKSTPNPTITGKPLGKPNHPKTRTSSSQSQTPRKKTGISLFSEAQNRLPPPLNQTIRMILFWKPFQLALTPPI
jgi:hypothetical protein